MPVASGRHPRAVDAQLTRNFFAGEAEKIRGEVPLIARPTHPGFAMTNRLQVLQSRVMGNPLYAHGFSHEVFRSALSRRESARTPASREPQFTWC
jgi:hypothetical protein